MLFIRLYILDIIQRSYTNVRLLADLTRLEQLQSPCSKFVICRFDTQQHWEAPAFPRTDDSRIYLFEANDKYLLIHQRKAKLTERNGDSETK